MDFNKNQVISAFLASDASDVSDDGSEGDEYLISFKKSQQAWTILPEILETENLDCSIYRQASNMLNNKLQYDLHQLPEFEYQNLSQTILSMIIIFHFP